MVLRNFKFNCEKQKYDNPKTYYKFEIINLQFINTYQVCCITLTIFNIWVQLHYIKNED